MSLQTDAFAIINDALKAASPDLAVHSALTKIELPADRLVLVSIGKAAWRMAKSASDMLGDRIDSGIVITKYDHSGGDIPRILCCEAGHPIPDANTYAATQRAIDLVSDLSQNDAVLFLVSGGGSALFEKPCISLEEMQRITRDLLCCGADIVEINTLRKRFSQVKGGRFAELCKPAQVYAIVLSDILGDPLDMIASGPSYPDSSTCAQAQEIAAKYHLQLSPEAEACLRQETPKALSNVHTQITGSVRQLCEAAQLTCRELGYRPVLLTTQLCCTARDAGSFLASIARTHADTKEPLAFIAGGETVVVVTGDGMGGRNQELALSAALGIDGLDNVCIFSVGSDGTDGPTDAAGGYVDGQTVAALLSQSENPRAYLDKNDAYHALQKSSGLIVTGPTGTNVNDLSVVLIRPR